MYVCVSVCECVCVWALSQTLQSSSSQPGALTAEGQTGSQVDDLQEGGGAGPPDLAVVSTSPDFTWNTQEEVRQLQES